MTFNAHSPHPRRQEQGIALVVVLLFTAIILTLVVSTTATLALGARGGGVNERAAYQALLASESGQNTFAARFKVRQATTPFTGATAANLTTWLNSLNSYSTETGNATITFDDVNYTSTGGGTFTVISTATSGNATKIVLQNYNISSTNPLSNLRLRSAFESLPPINANGSLIVRGRSNDNVAAQVLTNTTASASNTNVSLPVNSTDAFAVGDYIKVSGVTLRVNSISPGTLGLTRVSNIASDTTLTGNVTLMLNAVASSYSSVNNPMNVRISNYKDLVFGEKVTINGSIATVSGIDSTSGTVLLSWASTLPASLPEGTQVIRDITATRSAQEITPKDNKLDAIATQVGDGTLVNDCSSASVCRGENDPLLRSPYIDSTTFTQNVLGMSDQELNQTIPLTARTTMPNNEIIRITAANFDSLFSGNSSGSGVVIVDGDINTNINGTVNFNGLIYFRGNLGGKLNGNLVVNGAVAVRGGPIEGVTYDDVTTDATGNLTINYDGVALRKQLRSSKGGLEVRVVAQTWRQR